MTTMNNNTNANTHSNPTMDPQKFNSTMSSLNYGTVMEQAARDYQKEILTNDGGENPKQKSSKYDSVDLRKLNEDDCGDLEEELRKKRLEQLKNGEFSITNDILFFVLFLFKSCRERELYVCLR